MELEELVERDVVDRGNGSAPDDLGWDQVGATLQDMVGKDAFQRWFGSARWLGVDDDAATIAVPGEIHQVWIETNYLPELTMAVTGFFDDVREVRVIVGENAESGEAAGDTGAEAKEAREVRPTRAAALEGEALERRIKAAGLNPALTFSSFVVGANSQFAQAACEAVATKKGIAYNPLFIHGGPGLGEGQGAADERAGLGIKLRE